ncbi:MAG: ribbon-helix-helix protein, CopG family [Nanohaloarchaea archaeon]|nr:ribbon-helix-helix protein, CopG family [Candidatus Nanohaloarchaea archaeon]
MAKKRVSLTLEEEMVEKIDAEAEERELNRSQTVEEIAEKYFGERGIDTAVVFCGDPEAKSLELHNGKPVLSHILDHLAEEGINRAILLSGKNKEIEESFGSEYSGLALEYIEDEPEGTAAALKKVEGKVDGEFAALNGHVIADVDMDEMLRFHREESSVATIALTSVEDPSSYGVARLKGRKVLGFVEKPEDGEEPSRLINAGTYIFGSEIFSMLEEESIETVFKNLADQKQLSGYIYGGKWRNWD